MTNVLHKIRTLLDLRKDTDFENTDKSIRSNVDFESGNAWTLVFAIFIASVGLNVNSAAVIIGAMLISPLMGPTVGAGYSLGVNDFNLLKRSFRNLVIAMLISIATSTIYFLISPYDEAQSELLARTAPNFYDVLIAFFGGAAGIVALSRKEKSNAIPGVAIATALMPPLCTAGYGIANGEWKYTLGAMYLFVINSVFICLSTYLFVRSLKFRKVAFSVEREQVQIKRWIMITAGVVVIPSLFTAWLLMRESNFNSRVKKYIDNEFKFPQVYILEKNASYNWKNSSIKITLVGKKLSTEKTRELQDKKKYYDLEDTVLLIEQVGNTEGLQKTMARNQNQTGETIMLHQKVNDLEKNQKVSNELEEKSGKLKSELMVLYPDIVDLNLQTKKVVLFWKKAPSKNIKEALAKFLKIRLDEDQDIRHVLAL